MTAIDLSLALLSLLAAYGGAFVSDLLVDRYS